MVRQTVRVDNSERIANDVSRQIRSNKWDAGHVIPPLRTLAKRYDVSHETVRRALQALEEQGMVRKIQGRGTVVESSASARETMGSAFPPDPLFRKQLTVRSAEIGTEKEGLWNQAGAAFMAQQPNIGLTFASFSRSNFHPAVDQMPDILHAPTWQLEDHAAQGLLLNMRPFCEEEPLYGADLMPNTALQRGSEPLFHVPLTFDIRIMYVNLDQIPARELGALREDWTIERVTAWMSRNAVAGQEPTGIPRPRVLLSLFGVEPTDVLGFRESLKRLPASLKKMSALHQEHALYGDEELHRDASMDAFSEFLAQRLSLVVNHTFGLTAAMKRMKSRWAVLPVPVAPNACPPRYGMSCAITRACCVPEAAMSFIRFLTEPRGQQLFAAGRSNIPVRRSTALSTAFLTAPPSGMSDVVESAGRTREYFFSSRPAFSMAWASIWDEELLFFLLRKRPVAEAVERIRRRCEMLTRAHQLG